MPGWGMGKAYLGNARQHCCLSICDHFGWVWQISEANPNTNWWWDEQACLGNAFFETFLNTTPVALHLLYIWPQPQNWEWNPILEMPRFWKRFLSKYLLGSVRLNCVNHSLWIMLLLLWSNHFQTFTDMTWHLKLHVLQLHCRHSLHSLNWSTLWNLVKIRSRF